MRFKKLTKAIAVFGLAIFASVGVGANSTDVEAAYVDFSGDVQQVAADKTSATISWQPAENAVAYNIYCEEYAAEGEPVLVGTTTTPSYTITGLKSGMKYDIKITGTDGVTESGSNYANVVTLPDQLTGLKQSRWYYYIKELEVEWDEQSAVDGYEVSLYDDKGKLVNEQIIDNSWENDAEFKNMKYKVYTVKVRSFMTYNGQKYYSSYATIYCLNQANVTKATVSGNKLHLKWGKVSGATGYNVYVSTKSDSGYKKVAKISKKKNSCTISKFKGKKFSSKKTYHVYVETVCNKGKTKNTSGRLYTWIAR